MLYGNIHRKKLVKSVAWRSGKVCLGGMVGMQVTLWGHRPGFGYLAVFGVGGRSVGGSQVAQ